MFDQIHAGQGAPAYQQPEGSAASRFGSGFWDYSLGGLLNLVKGAGSLAAQVGGAASGAPPMLDPNSAGGKLIQGIVMGHVDQAQKAKDAWERGQYTEALGHTLATFLPLLGPAAAHIGETAGGSQPKFDAKGNVVESGQAPDIPQALGQAAGLGASYALPAAAEKIPRPNLTPAGPLTAAPRIQAAQDLMAEGEARHVRLSAGDISQNPAIQNMEVAAEKIPGVGMGKFRIGQQADVKLAAQKLQSNAFEKFLDTEPSDIGDLQKAAQDGDARATQVLDKFKVAGSDPALNQQASIGLADWSTRDTATKLYDKVQDLAEQHHLGDVPMTNTQAALKSSLAELGPAILQDKPTIALLNEIRNGISPKPAPLVKPSGLLGPNGQPIPAPEAQPVAPTNTYQLIRQLHSDLGARIRDYYSPDSNSLIGEKGVGYLERVQHAMEGDMSAYASQSGVPEIVKAGQLADEYYKTARVPFKTASSRRRPNRPNPIRSSSSSSRQARATARRISITHWTTGARRPSATT